MTTPIQRRLLTGGTLAVLAVLFVAIIVLSNVLLRGARIDLTENRLYTLSPGTLAVLAEIDEPINLYFFFSDRGTRDIPALRTYATRVRELLEEMVSRSGGKLRLSVIDPLPFSEEEDRATAFGLQAVPVGNAGETIFFGLAGSNSTDGQMVIPFFQPDKEAFLEYDVAKLIHSLNTTTKPVVGVVSGLPVGPGFDPQRRGMRPGWAFFQSLQELFEVRQLSPATLGAIPEEIKTVVLIHPKELSDEAEYAIDQFVLRGGRLLVFVDPNAELDESANDPENPSAAAFANRSSNLPRLFRAWGVNFDPARVVLDAAAALQVQSPTGAPVRHLAILGYRNPNMNREDVITAELGNVNFSSAGAFAMTEGAALALEPLIQSSTEAMLAPADRLRFLADPTTLFQDFVPTGTTYVLAGRLSGNAKTAFPERSGEAHLAESSGPVEIVVVADTDVLSDRLWVQIANFFGQQVMNAFANNGDFVVNAVDNLTGSSALISIRGRAISARPFTTVERLRRQADARFREKEQELQAELAETERKLNELQQRKDESQATVLSAEQRAELQRFQQRKVEIRRELRQVRRQLDADIESLGNWLKVINIGLVPLLLTAGAIAFAYWRRRRVTAPRGAAA
jgi:ABC-type uncharacterized transport system involved in gliding motility auxiliary subunit